MIIPSHYLIPPNQDTKKTLEEDEDQGEMDMIFFLCVTLFSICSVSVPHVYTNPDNLYPSTQLVFIRAIVCLILSAMWLRKEKESFLPEDTRTRNLLIYRSCIGVGGMLGNWFLIMLKNVLPITPVLP